MEKLVIKILIWLSSLSYTNDIQYLPSEQNCLDCHKKLVEQPVIHSPTDDCTNCHEANGQEHPNAGSKEFTLMAEGADLCYVCHDSKNEKKNIHLPVQEGECLTCHSPHSSAEKYLLTESPVSTLCSNCHDLELSSLKFRHKPVNEGKCTDCHDSHQSDQSHLLKSEQPALCFSCHEKTKAQTSLKNQHPPFESECSSCHKHHASEEPNLLTAKTKDLCLICHSEMEESLSNATLVHEAINSDETCVYCHSPHASNEGKLMQKEQKLVCLSCHNKTYTSGNKKIDNIKLILQNSKHIHAPVEDACTNCHNPHYSGNSALLIEKYTQQPYTLANPDSFALCFACHDSVLMSKKTTTSATNFRNGDKNLHYLHLNFSKSRNCNLCHNVHGSKNSFLIQDKVEFGKWQMPVYFEVFENGATCSTGCHEPKKYER